MEAGEIEEDLRNISFGSTEALHESRDLRKFTDLLEVIELVSA